MIPLLCLILLCVGQAEQAPFAYEPSLTKRVNYSDVVCSATITKTEKTGITRTIGGKMRNEIIAEASIGQVFKGAFPARSIRVRYFDYGILPTADFMTPPLARLEVHSRYILFLKSVEGSLEVAVPVWQMEIRLAPRPISEAEAVSRSLSGLAEELFYSIKTSPESIGRSATHYFSWAEEVTGCDAIPDVSRYLTSDDALVRYQAAWWLSFRDLTAPVMHVLTETSENPSIEQWARSGARDRLKDIQQGNWVPK